MERDSQRERAKILFGAFPALKSAYMASMKFRNIFETSKSREIARQGGYVAGTARKVIEQKTGESVVTPKNAKVLQKRKLEELE